VAMLVSEISGFLLGKKWKNKTFEKVNINSLDKLTVPEEQLKSKLETSDIILQLVLISSYFLLLQYLELSLLLFPLSFCSFQRGLLSMLRLIVIKTSKLTFL